MVRASYLQLLQVGGVAPFLVVSDASDSRKSDGNATSRVAVGAAELCPHDLPHRGDLHITYTHADQLQYRLGKQQIAVQY